VPKLVKPILLSFISVLAGFSASLFINTSAQDQVVYELRTYTATPGNLDNLHARFRDHTTRIFAKHGMEVVAYWTPTDEEKSEDTLIYVLKHANREAADASWSAFIEDPEWTAVAEASNANGPILGGIEREYMIATDYSPMQ
jgi:hypothetical protein